MRGEDEPEACIFPPRTGSPPHARGRLAARGLKRDNRRITPACAGKTPETRLRPPPWPDHPRMRGEDFRVLAPGGVLIGSPPHARGRPGPGGKYQPAGVDHPRMRGEDSISDSMNSTSDGSPPHARGRLRDVLGDGAPARITPACAGKTFTQSRATT